MDLMFFVCGKTYALVSLFALCVIRKIPGVLFSSVSFDINNPCIHTSVLYIYTLLYIAWARSKVKVCYYFHILWRRAVFAQLPENTAHLG